MADFRQENHNGRVSTTTGAVYNRSHNDREFDVSRAENINPDMMRQNIIIHYGLDISHNKALEEMGFERPNPEKSINKWNNAKITFSEMERNLKLRICEDHGLSVEHTPLHPGKSTMEKEEAIALKLQEENQEYREETDRLIDERKDKISSLDATIEKKESKLEKVSAELVTEEMKNKAVADTNIFGKHIYLI